MPPLLPKFTYNMIDYADKGTVNNVNSTVRIHYAEWIAAGEKLFMEFKLHKNLVE